MRICNACHHTTFSVGGTAPRPSRAAFVHGGHPPKQVGLKVKVGFQASHLFPCDRRENKENVLDDCMITKLLIEKCEGHEASGCRINKIEDFLFRTYEDAAIFLLEIFRISKSSRRKVIRLTNFAFGHIATKQPLMNKSG